MTHIHDLLTETSGRDREAEAEGPAEETRRLMELRASVAGRQAKDARL